MDNNKWSVYLSLQGNDSSSPPTDIKISTGVEEMRNRFNGLKVFESLPINDFKKILVVGAIAPEIVLFKEKGYDVSGVSQHWGDKKQAEQVYGVNIKVEDMHDLNSFVEGSFDGVYSHHALEHTISPIIALFEIRRVLRLGGKLLFFVPTFESEKDNKDLGGQHYSVFPFEVWRHLLDLCGFEQCIFENEGASLHVTALKANKGNVSAHWETTMKNRGLWK